MKGSSVHEKNDNKFRAVGYMGAKMSYSSCIRHPASSKFIQIHEWQTQFCQGSMAAAFLVSYFSTWHDWKLKNDSYYRRSNDIAETHGDGRPYNEKAYLFFSTQHLVDASLGLFGKKAITSGLELLTLLGVITTHKNPNPRYHFDKTKYFKFYPKVCNRWLDQKAALPDQMEHKDVQVLDNYDNAEMDNRLLQKERRLVPREQPSCPKSQAITDNTIYTTNKNNQSLNTRDDFSNNEKKETTIPEDIKPIMDALVEKGMSCKHFHYPDVTPILQDLKMRGATTPTFVEAYDLSFAATGQGFGIRYLAKVVENLLSKSSKPKAYPSHSPPTSNLQDSEQVYEENDWKNLEWMGKGWDDVK
jgi:hypothetical protein